MLAYRQVYETLPAFHDANTATEPVNRYFGRRGAIWISCFVSCVTCVWQAFTHSWQHMFVARFFLGVGIGIKSASVPIYSSECAPKAIRGALTMQWQMCKFE